MSWNKKDERNHQIVERRRSGERLRSIACAYGITHERVRQILQAEGGDPLESMAHKVRRLVAEGRTMDEMVEETGRSRRHISRVVSDLGLASTHSIRAEIARKHECIVTEFRAGTSRADLAEAFGMTRNSINNLLNCHGIRERKVRMKPNEVEAIRPVIEAELRNHPHLKLAEIGRRHGVQWHLVRNIRERMKDAA